VDLLALLPAADSANAAADGTSNSGGGNSGGGRADTLAMVLADMRYRMLDVGLVMPEGAVLLLC
jgi:hypothetical protein